MIKKIFFTTFLSLIFLCSFILAEGPTEKSDILVKSKPKTYHITITTTAENMGCTLKTLSIVLPYPQSDDYQDINNISLNNGQLMTVEDRPEKYVRFLFNEQTAPQSGMKEICQISFDATLYHIDTDLNKISEVYDYNQNSNIYQLYTGENYPLIVQDNPDIQKISAEIWNKSNGFIDYAKQCYLYVAKNFHYKNANTGLHPLADLLANNGGDCGNLSSIYISLLRSKKIPARHLVTVRPNGTYHVWAEFYLEKYGWIPVDVTFKNSNFSGNYFGNIDHATNGIILNKDVNLKIKVTDSYQYTMPLLQTYGFWYWKSGSGEIKVSYKIQSATLK